VSIAALKAARPLLREWRQVVHDSAVAPDGSLPTSERQEVERFDRAIALIDRALARHRAARKRPQ